MNQTVPDGQSTGYKVHIRECGQMCTAVATGARHAFRILETELYKTDSPLFKSLTIQFGFFAATNKVAAHRSYDMAVFGYFP